METTVLISAVTALASILVTVIIFVFGFRDRLTRVEESIKRIDLTLANFATVVNSRPICDYHAAMDKSAAVREERLQRTEERVLQFEQRLTDLAEGRH